MGQNQAFTGTPDATSGNAIAVVQVTNSASQIVDQQVITIGDKTDGTLQASVTASGLAVQTGLVTVSQNATWTISGAVTMTGQVTVTGTANVALSTGAATIGQIALVTGAATIGQVALATGAAVVGALATGTATIGQIAIVTGAATIGAVVLATGAAVIGALATGTATLGQVQVATGAAFMGQVSGSDETSTVYNGTTALTPLFVAISAQSAAAVVIVTAVAAKQIRVLEYVIVAGAVNAVTWQSSGTAISGTIALATNTGISSGYCPIGHFQTVVSAQLEMKLGSTNVTVAGHMTYVTV